MVTHGGVVRVLMKYTLGLSIDTPTNFLIKNTGIFRLIWKENWLVKQMGVVSHLEK
jgi:broad specificity phosphatase PhoE